MQKKIALLHRYPADRIKETNAAFPYLRATGMDVLTFKKFDRLSSRKKFWKSIAWIFYAPILVLGKGYDVIYCDDSYPFYPLLVKLASPKSKLVLRIGDLHLMYYTHGRLYKFLHFFEKLTWRTADLVIAISEEMASYIFWEGKCDNVTLVFDPVDPRDFPTTNSQKPENRVVMFHGVLTRNKNVDVMLEAARRMPEVDFWVVGDGPDLKRLQSIATKNVWFGGWQPFKSIHELINSCDVGVALRSDNPGNEYVVTSPFLQYGVMSKPCVVTRRRVFGKYPWQFSRVDDLVEHLKTLLKDPFDEGRKLRKYVLENHDAEKIGAQIWSLLQS